MNVSETLKYDKILEYSVFDNSAQPTIIAVYGFENYYEILTLEDSDIIILDK